MDYGKIHKRLGKDSICVPFKKQNKNQYATFQLNSHDYSHSKTHQTLLDIHSPPPPLQFVWHRCHLQKPQGRPSHTLAWLGEAELSGTQLRCLRGSCCHHKVSLVHSVTQDSGPGQEQHSEVRMDDRPFTCGGTYSCFLAGVL